ncbi:hypothetical protein K505DRAFT_123749 [Melanomma pulvis-pyrius CBS 109.77]|uniref:Uncharacterized protein n=1 Tax=Melanomma pulvis-pyrius CBS 109.77 TaxID=1314802 RepID=A0A6A6XNG3_9PLEO|nr:hypothetical protein K505DRAFT_123749 [Melanomma pulvis-pyrius CBS 109.77]
MPYYRLLVFNSLHAFPSGEALHHLQRGTSTNSRRIRHQSRDNLSVPESKPHTDRRNMAPKLDNDPVSLRAKLKVAEKNLKDAEEEIKELNSEIELLGEVNLDRKVEIDSLKKSLEAAEPTRVALTETIFDLLMDKMSKEDIKKVAREVEEKVQLGLLLGDRVDSGDGGELEEPIPRIVLETTLLKRDARVKQAKKVDDERRKAAANHNDDLKQLQQKPDISVAAGENSTNVVRLMRKRNADAIESPDTPRGSKGSRRVITCIQCYKQNLTCDNASPCKSCVHAERKCTRAACTHWETGKCIRPNCSRWHVEDGEGYVIQRVGKVFKSQNQQKKPRTN